MIESVSVGHEDHDRETKKLWYAEAGVPNYWILDGYSRSLDCLVLDPPQGIYRVDQAGRSDATLSPSAFPGLMIRLAELWDA